MKLKIFIYLFFFGGEMQRLFALELPTGIQAYLQQAIVSEAGYPSGTELEIIEFAEYISGNWEALVADIQIIAPDERRQRVVISGAELLDGDQYLSFLSALLEKHSSGKIGKKIIVEAISGYGKKSGFLAYNYKNQSVRDICDRVKILFGSDLEIQRKMNDILSGAEKRRAALAAFNEGRPEPEVLP